MSAVSKSLIQDEEKALLVLGDFHALLVNLRKRVGDDLSIVGIMLIKNGSMKLIWVPLLHVYQMHVVYKLFFKK